ncbi:unnamed protein product [Caenorhabditis sp. 36 PRJEB53466]|nr:unnamed protein product [Caenorhabditis sp. 36 PRJEB53466]
MLSYGDDSAGCMQKAIFEFKIQRNPMYYMYMIVFPSFIINALSLIGVFMRNSDRMSKLNVGLTNIMTMTFILGVMADKIPKSGSIPLLGIYIIINLFIMIFAYWYDPRLAWDSTKYGDIDMLHMRQERVWSPTLSLFKINDMMDLRDQDFRLVCVTNVGHVYTSLTLRVSVNCPMNVNRFPFDSQICSVQFNMPIFYMQQVKMFNEIYQGILNTTVWETMGNSEWDLVNLTNRIDLLTYNDMFGDMELATFEFKIQRNPMYYIYMIVFPSFIINALSIIGVFMKNTDKMSKLNVGLTNIMTMTFILGVMSDKIPKTGSIPLLGIYIIINLFIMIVAVGITVAIGELRKWALPRLKLKKHKLSQKLEYILGDPLETICAVFLELLTTANFIMMIIFWISDA